MRRLDPLLVPFWATTTMHRESAMLAGDDERATATLLFRPDVIVAVTNAGTGTTYVEGVDYILARAERRIRRVPGSPMPWTDWPATASADGALTHDRTVAISYTYAPDQSLWRPPSQLHRIPAVAARLREGRLVTVCLTGDSISEGYDSSGFHGRSPFQPPYASLVNTALQQLSGAPVRLHNLATAGWTTAEGMWDIDRITAAESDLVIVAFGMNDASYADGDEFAANVALLLERVRARRPSVEFLLVSPMLPTPQCAWVTATRFADYQVRLRDLAGEGIAFVDVTRLWSQIVERKSPYDLSGNGLNHPNDFGHRLYAHAIVAALSSPGEIDAGNVES